MALIKCPECGKQISDKAKTCIGCGYPIKEHLEELKEKEENRKLYICSSCGTQNNDGEDYCISCGMRLTPYHAMPSEHDRADEIEKEGFRGIYRSTIFGLQEVYCPRCGSEDCSHYQEQKVVPQKTKTRYTANLNPLRPFTLLNKKEKVVREEEIVIQNKFLCNKCGKIFN